jgi:hypothetical protein
MMGDGGSLTYTDLVRGRAAVRMMADYRIELRGEDPLKTELDALCAVQTRLRRELPRK